VSDYYDRDELTRPGHTPRLTSGPYGAEGSCTCGWWFAGSTMLRTTQMIRGHIGYVDNGRWDPIP
jgi:hypothetical protein